MNKIINSLTTYEVKDLITNTSDLTVDEKKYVAYSISSDISLPHFKAEHFVGNAQITPYAKIKQYLLELSSREDVIEAIEYDARKCKVKINRLKKDAENLSGFDLEEINIDIEHEERNYKKYMHKLKLAYSERRTFLNLINKFNESPEGKYEDGRLLIDVVGDPVIAEKLEQQHWTYRMAKQSAMDMIAYGRIGVGNMDAIAMMQPDQQEAVLRLASEYVVRNEQRMSAHLSYANEMKEKGVTSDQYMKLLSSGSVELLKLGLTKGK
jgi:hypothetical protein